MERFAFAALSTWKGSKNRKPLIIQGARQVGKTFTLLQFGNTNYKNVAYFNFENNLELNRVFSKEMSPAHIVPQLMLLSNQTIFEENRDIVLSSL